MTVYDNEIHDPCPMLSLFWGGFQFSALFTLILAGGAFAIYSVYLVIKALCF